MPLDERTQWVLRTLQRWITLRDCLDRLPDYEREVLLAMIAGEGLFAIGKRLKLTRGCVLHLNETALQLLADMLLNVPDPPVPSEERKDP